MKRKRYIIDDSAHPIFVTTTITEWTPVFDDVRTATQSLRTLEHLRSEMGFLIFAYVLMPHHFHSIVRTNRKGDLSNLMRKWKSLTARLITNKSVESHPDRLRIFENNAIRFRREAVEKFQVWQPRFDDFAIRTPEQFATRLDYIHTNPVRQGLVEKCEEYPYSSIHDYSGGKNKYLTVELWS